MLDMNGFEARKLVTVTLRKRGAVCLEDTVQPSMGNIIATWQITTWRILVIPEKFKTGKIIITEDRDIKRLIATSAKNNQKAVIAYVSHDDDIVYYDLEKGSTVRPRCLIRRRTTDTIKKTWP